MKLDYQNTGMPKRVVRVCRDPGNVGRGWNDERTEALKKLWAEGLSASQIAGRIGGITRNSVIGKIHRLGLCRADVRINTRKILQRAGAVSAARRKSIMATAEKKKRLIRLGRYDEARAAFVVVTPVFKAAPLPPERMPPPRLVSFDELEPNQCKFIFGDPKTKDHGFCGHHTVPGTSYCSGHNRVCSAGLPEPRRRTRSYVDRPAVSASFKTRYSWGYTE